MYFLYADGSGHAKMNYNRKNNGRYILSGVIVHEGDWKMIEEDIVALKRELFPGADPEEIELHAHAIWNNSGFFADKRMNVDLAKKQEIFSKVLDLVCRSKITLINVVIFKDKMNALYNTPDPMEYSWTLIMERFEHFLKNKQEGTNNGLIFMDSSCKVSEAEIRRIIFKLVRKGNTWQRIEHVLDDLIFVQSHLRNLVQIADMVAYVIHRHYKGDPKFKDWFERLKPKLYQPNGKLDGYGIKEFP